MVKRYRVSLGGDENVLKLTVAMVAHSVNILNCTHLKKRNSRHLVVKLKNTKNKEKPLKGARVKAVHYKTSIITLSDNFSTEKNGSQKTVN